MKQLGTTLLFSLMILGFGYSSLATACLTKGKPCLIDSTTHTDTCASECCSHQHEKCEHYPGVSLCMCTKK